MAKRGKGEGSIAKRPNGTWYARYTVHLPDGTTKRPAVYGKTRREVSEKLAKVLEEIRHGTRVEPSKQTVGEYLSDWLAQKRAAIKPLSYVNYEVVVRVHLTPALGSILLQELSVRDVEQYRNRKLAQMSAKSVSAQLAVLRAALDQAVRWNYVQRNVAAQVDNPRMVKHRPATMSVDEVQRLLEALRGDRLEASYYVVIGCALRCGELLGLRWCDVDLDRRTLSVAQSVERIQGIGKVIQTPKTEGGIRRVVMPQFVVRALSAHRDRQWLERKHMGRRWQDYDLVFPTNKGTPYEPRSLARHLERTLAKAGLPHYSLHELRHTSATIMDDQGVPLKTLSKIMGHSTTGITADLYIHPYDSAMADAADKMDNLFGDKG